MGTDFAQIIIEADAIINENHDTIQALETEEDKLQEYRNCGFSQFRNIHWYFSCEAVFRQ